MSQSDHAGEGNVFAGVFVYPRLTLERGEGTWVWDDTGKRYLDFTAGLGVLALGHGRRDLADIMASQFTQLGHCSNLFANAPAIHLAQMLKDASFAQRVWLACSGTEVVEAALKFARLVGHAAGGPQKHAFVAFERGFHGRTMGALSVTHEPAYRLPFAPVMPGVRFARLNDVASVEAVMDEHTCGVVIEPVQGEGGVHVARPDFLREVRRLCDRHDAVLIFDEIQAGLGRTGELFAYQHSDMLPDMLCLAKPLGAGLPIGALLLNDRVAAVLRPGQHGSTFGGGPTVCAVAVAMLRMLQKPALLINVRERATQLRAGLQHLADTHAFLLGCRGVGLMQALVVAPEAGVQQQPRALVQRAQEHGLLLTRAGKDAVRFLPPLNCTAVEVTLALERLTATLQDAACS